MINLPLYPPPFWKSTFYSMRKGAQPPYVYIPFANLPVSLCKLLCMLWENWRASNHYKSCEEGNSRFFSELLRKREREGKYVKSYIDICPPSGDSDETIFMRNTSIPECFGNPEMERYFREIVWKRSYRERKSQIGGGSGDSGKRDKLQLIRRSWTRFRVVDTRCKAKVVALNAQLVGK